MPLDRDGSRRPSARARAAAAWGRPMPAVRTFALLAFALAAPVTGVTAADDASALCREAEERYRQLFGKASAEAAPPVVLMYRSSFCPQRLAVKRGGTVQWVNVDRRTSHSVWFREAGRPESERKFPEEHIEMTIDLPPGEHPYLCGPHWERDGMVGSLVVD